MDNFETKNPDHQIFVKGKYIYSEADYSNKIYFIIAGRVKIGYLSESGRKITMAILKEGDFFGEQSLAGITRRKDFAKALKNTTIRVISMQEVAKLMKGDEALSLLLLNKMARRILDT